MNVKNNFFIINPLFYSSATVIFFTSILIHPRRPIQIGRAFSALQRVISIKPQRRPDQIPHQQRRGDHQRTHHQPQIALHDCNLRNTQSRWNIVWILHNIFQTTSNLKEVV